MDDLVIDSNGSISKIVVVVKLNYLFAPYHSWILMIEFLIFQKSKYTDS